jgi:uncharacterized membrane protein
MKPIKRILLILLVAFYLFSGVMHLMAPAQYMSMMPAWLPAHYALIIISGLVEIALALLLIPVSTRAMAARAIILMLIVFFFVIHIPESVMYYQKNDERLITSIIRLPFQFLFVVWAYVFVKKDRMGEK